MQATGLPLHEWLALLESYSPQEINLGLERVELLLQRMDLSLPESVLHVAGTNGKGSSAAMLEALLRHSDKKIGCFTSPHILHYNERIRIDGVAASDAQIIAAFESIDAVRGEVPLTYFEFGTLAALAVFADAGVEVAILEVGLGGRLDAVNAVEPTASLITNISLDHCAWLGDTVEAIAREKAGVMRPGKAAVFASPEMPAAIVDHADAIGANLYAAQRDYQWSGNGDTWSWVGVRHSLENLQRPSLTGEFQIQNAAGVLTLLELAGFGALLTAKTVDAALGQIELAGRLQTVGDQWLLDVAHNPAAAQALASVLVERSGSGRTIVILGMLDDKDVAGVVMPLAQHVDAWIAVTADHARALPAAELARQVANSTGKACLISESITAAMQRAEAMCGSNDLVLVTGSFYVVSGILAALGHSDG